MGKILYYYPSNKRSNVIETTLKEIKDLGHEVLFLSTIERGALHTELEKIGIETFSASIQKTNPLLYYFKQLKLFIKTCKTQKIDIVFSSLQHTNLIAVLAQYFISTRVIAFRHHFKISKRDFKIGLKINRNELIFDKLINRLAKDIIVPAESIKKNMLEYENVDPNKVKVIPYMYDLAKMNMPKDEEVKMIRSKYSAKLLMIIASRLVPFKRHREVLPLIGQLIDEGLDLKLIILDEGPEERWIRSFINAHGLEDYCFLLGYQTNPLAYIQASDLLIHPSLTEASSNVIKEAGLLSKAVAVCKGVGDFDEYIINGKNGFLIDPLDPNLRLEEIIRSLYSDKRVIEKLGRQLNSTVKAKFIDRGFTIGLYKQLIDRTL